MTEESLVTNRFGTGVVLFVFFVLPVVSLVLGGDYPIIALFVLLPVGSYILVFKREWWWTPIRRFVDVGEE